MEKIKTAGLIGMGAIGCVYGKFLFDVYGDDFSVIAAGARGEKIKKEGVKVNGHQFFPRVAKAPETMDLILLAVKNYQLASAIEDMRPFVGEETILLPLLNGITAVEELEKAFPGHTVLEGLAIGVDAVRNPDGVVNLADGVIQFGPLNAPEQQKDALLVKEYLDGCHMPNEYYEDMTWAMWRKWMLNVGINQVSALGEVPYGGVAQVPESMQLLREAMTEVAMLAQAKGINLGEKEVEGFVSMMEKFSPEGKTSMCQDVENHRKTEIENFAGHVVELGKELGVDTPVNRVIYYVLKAKETLYLKK